MHGNVPVRKIQRRKLNEKIPELAIRQLCVHNHRVISYYFRSFQRMGNRGANKIRWAIYHMEMDSTLDETVCY